jgi:branched-chain amino acid transport system permease protein
MWLRDRTVTGPLATSMTQYYFVLIIVTLMTMLCINLTRGNLGRIWKATRDMDIAAELIGINLMKSKLMAFAVSLHRRRRGGACTCSCGKGRRSRTCLTSR